MKISVPFKKIFVDHYHPYSYAVYIERPSGVIDAASYLQLAEKNSNEPALYHTKEAAEKAVERALPIDNRLERKFIIPSTKDANKYYIYQMRWDAKNGYYFVLLDQDGYKKSQYENREGVKSCDIWPIVNSEPFHNWDYECDVRNFNYSECLDKMLGNLPFIYSMVENGEFF